MKFVEGALGRPHSVLSVCRVLCLRPPPLSSSALQCVTLQSLQTPSVTLQPPSVTLQPPSVTLQRPSVTLQPPSLSLQPPSVTLQPPSVTLQPPSVTLQPPSVTLQPPSVTLQRPSVTLQPYLSRGRSPPPPPDAPPHATDEDIPTLRQEHHALHERPSALERAKREAEASLSASLVQALGV